ncbi:MAG: DUF2953 domain-containing protein [Oscillospiraceae bacterium]|nr:DUF2953 domain-containing protein [Oscillospiraceae bacterium]
MTGWFIAGGVLLLFVLLSQLRLGAEAGSPEEGELFLTIRAGPFRFRLLPSAKKAGDKAQKKPKSKGAKKRTAKKPAQKKPKDSKKTGRGKREMLSLALHMVPPVAKAAGGLLRKIRIDRLELHLIWAAKDPASAAVGYGKAQAVMGMLWPPLERNFRVKERDLSVDVDFERAKPLLIAHVQITLTLGQLLSFSLRLAASVLPTILRKR